MTNPAANRLFGLPTAPAQEVGLSAPALARIGETMTREIAERRMPGVSLLISRRGKIAYSERFGALRPGGPAMPQDAIFRIYSMTKPIVAVAAMTLVEEGRLLLGDPLSKYLPAFAAMKVGVERGGALELTPARRPILIHDLFRHTSGLTYSFAGGSAVQRLVAQADIVNISHPIAEQIDRLAALPLQRHPGEAFEYGLSFDVLGRVLEVVSGLRLGEFLHRRVLAPLGMTDTGFFTPAEKRARLAEPFSYETLRANKIDLIDGSATPPFEMAGSGLVSTIGDFARFLAMIEGGGALEGVRILGARTLAFMTSDQLGPDVDRSNPFLVPGHGHGLGFAVRIAPGLAPTAGSVGEFAWGGVAGTAFWVSPRDELSAILMLHAPEDYLRPRLLYRNMVNAAIL
ncbi:MAG: class A beta-lactamase-related serine hydrolase [Bradyrhizobium sp.]|nr:MAG: class A beta-lactamase-related serine hydrolase [Bradyrhizobium sp.]